MNLAPAKVANMKLGISFDQWMRRPVYKVQCYTASIAHSLCGVKKQPGLGLATFFGTQDATGLTKFRCLKSYRDDAANDLRNRVAQHIKGNRSKGVSACL